MSTGRTICLLCAALGDAVAWTAWWQEHVDPSRSVQAEVFAAALTFALTFALQSALIAWYAR